MSPQQARPHRRSQSSLKATKKSHIIKNSTPRAYSNRKNVSTLHFKCEICTPHNSSAELEIERNEKILETIVSLIVQICLFSLVLCSIHTPTLLNMPQQNSLTPVEAFCDVCKGASGEMLTCTMCPRAFHVTCIGIHTSPARADTWVCIFCSSSRPVKKLRRRRRHHDSRSSFVTSSIAEVMVSSS